MADTISLAATGIFLLSGYLLGSISSAIVVSKLFGLADPRQIGSGNPGATNVLRYAGKKIAIITLAGDALKGVVPIKNLSDVGSRPRSCHPSRFFCFSRTPISHISRF